jgi:Flp pilus assembly protein TadD
VDLPPSWDLRNRDAFLFLRHVNAKVKLGHSDVVVIDLEMDRYSPAYEQRFISEALVTAQFYNNRGMELSAAGDVKQGFLHLRKALLLDDQQSYIWSNFGTLYHRQGLLPEAEAAYLYGLSLAADDLTIMTNLSTLYRRMGGR